MEVTDSQASFLVPYLGSAETCTFWENSLAFASAVDELNTVRKHLHKTAGHRAQQRPEAPVISGISAPSQPLTPLFSPAQAPKPPASSSYFCNEQTAVSVCAAADKKVKTRK
jgi:hypothetical protein